MRLTALEAAAEGIGLKPGQGVAEARAMCPDLDVVEEDEAADRRLLEAMADWCDRYTPLVSLDGRDGLFLDITGCAHLFGGERALLKDILFRLFHLGLEVHGAISASPGLSWAVARFGRSGVVDGETAPADVLARMPVAALRLDTPIVNGLCKLGLKYIGDVLKAPRAPLTRRFGAQVLLRIDQAVGDQDEPVSPRRPVASLSVERRLIEPIGREEDILAVTAQIAQTLKTTLEARGVGGRLFELLLFRVDGKVFRIVVGTSKPLRGSKEIAALFSERLQAIHEDLDAGYGFEILRLNVLSQEAFDAPQQDFTGGLQVEEQLSTFVDRVSARLGEECLQRFALCESHVPERAVISVPAMTRETVERPALKDPVTWSRNERPLRLFSRPERVESVLAEVPDGPPQIFRWRRLRHQVARSEGPERLAMEWWIDGLEDRIRDYFRIEDQQGRRFWLFRRGLYGGEIAPEWFMHGVFA